MNPIINPWLVYSIYTVDNISKLSIIIGIFLLTYFLSYTVITAMHNTDYNLSKPTKAWRMLLVIPFFILSSLIPDKDTMYKIVAAKMITPDNITKTISAGKILKDEVKNDVIDIIKSIKEPSETKKEK